MKRKFCFKSKDVLILFDLVCLFFIGFSMTLFFLYIFKQDYPAIPLNKIASTMNTGIAIVGLGEGIRSFNKTANSDIGESSPVPAYKISFLIRFIILFGLVSILSVMLEIYCRNNPIKDVIAPDFACDNMIECLLSTFLAYLFAKYGNKIAIDIDLSNLSFFKRK